MKQTKRSKIGNIILSLLFAMSLSFGVARICLVHGNTEAIAETASEEPSFSEIGLQGKEYVKGTQLSVPSVKMTYKAQQYVALSVLHCPDGSAQYVNETVTLSSVGKYTVEYKATVGGTTYNKEESFTVYQPKFELTYGEGKAEYSTDNASGLEGELVSLEEGQTLIIRDYFDLTKATASEPVFEACIIPDKKGTADFQTLTVRFVSKNDPSQYLEIVGNHYDYNNCTYFLAGANTQTVTGYESSQGTIHVGNTWGAPISGSFRFTPNNNMAIKDDTMKIYLDYETKTVYANTGKVFVVDLDDPKYFGTLWDGFEDGEVYIEVSASRYQSSKPAQFLVMKAGNIDLEQQNVYDTEEPEITVDFAGYPQSELPSGAKGRAYPIFHASAKDYLCGACDVDVRVWARYYTSQKYEVEIKDGAFVPENAGTYVIEYSAVDKTGNRAVRLININVVDDAEEINISLTDKQTSGKTGEFIQLARVAADGGSGNLAIDVKVLFGGEAVEIGESGFLARKAGNYTVEVTATDYIGSTQSESYTVSVAANDSPVFLDKIELPKYLIAGSEYAFGEVFAYDYTSGNDEKTVKATLYTEDANGVKEHSDGKYTPSVASHLDTVKIYYKATVNGKTTESQTFDI